ncbi:MAG: PhoH family protein [Lentisphaeria bacterium]|nr:PhoH family protein [Lentisphaeria bacterium]
MKKMFVLDTNVLLHSAQSLLSFHDNDVVIPMAVVEELDKFKRNQDELGRNARMTIRRLDRLRQAGNLREGVSLSRIMPTVTGNLLVRSASAGAEAVDQKIRQVFETDLSEHSPDNRILRTAANLAAEGNRVIFISKDINLRLKADALGLEVMDFEFEKTDPETLYRGFREMTVTPAQLDRLYREKALPLPEGAEMFVQEFAFLQTEDGKKSALARCKGDKLLHLLENLPDGIRGIRARNREQRMALDLLTDPSVPLVTLIGGAGTGKTLLALAAALHCTVDKNMYDKILVTRPIIPLGNDIGFLPGDKDSKLSNWMQPVFDNLQLLIPEPEGKKTRRVTPEMLLQAGRIELEAITYIRGRSIPRQYIIIDEAQNLTPHEVKTVISRAGDGTKIILTGDPGQIDNPYLDGSSNGLSYVAERLKGNGLHGHIILRKSERSELAALAAKSL